MPKVWCKDSVWLSLSSAITSWVIGFRNRLWSTACLKAQSAVFGHINQVLTPSGNTTFTETGSNIRLFYTWFVCYFSILRPFKQVYIRAQIVLLTKICGFVFLELVAGFESPRRNMSSTTCSLPTIFYFLSASCWWLWAKSSMMNSPVTTFSTRRYAAINYAVFMPEH